MSDLKPCPFCGRAPRMAESIAGDYLVYCETPECPLGGGRGFHKKPWNTRPLTQRSQGQAVKKAVEALLGFAESLVNNEQEKSAIEMAGRFRNLRNSLAALRQLQGQGGMG